MDKIEHRHYVMNIIYFFLFFFKLYTAEKSISARKEQEKIIETADSKLFYISLEDLEDIKFVKKNKDCLPSTTKKYIEGIHMPYLSTVEQIIYKAILEKIMLEYPGDYYQEMAYIGFFIVEIYFSDIVGVKSHILFADDKEKNLGPLDSCSSSNNKEMKYQERKYGDFNNFIYWEGKKFYKKEILEFAKLIIEKNTLDFEECRKTTYFLLHTKIYPLLKNNYHYINILERAYKNFIQRNTTISKDECYLRLEPYFRDFVLTGFKNLHHDFHIKKYIFSLFILQPPGSFAIIYAILTEHFFLEYKNFREKLTIPKYNIFRLSDYMDYNECIKTEIRNLLL